MDVGGWLRKLGLEQYEAAFRENNIDEAILQSLTPEDLKELGIASVGHRRKLLDAVAALRAEATSPTAPSDTASAREEGISDTAERRQVTVMFSDLVGSTSLSARMDPEDLREIITAYHRCVAETVRRFGGFVAKYMGDGVLIYFGYPQAHEDDAERAVRAALVLIDEIATLAAPEPLQVRIGAATGMVVIGDLVGSGEAQERGIVGETPNLAARLQAIAEPNTVVIAGATRGLLGNIFELRDLAPRELKGIAGPVKAFAVLRASSVESRFEAMHPGGLTALVGREEELELLLRRWARAKTGEGQMVLLSGEAGIGKSRLTAALMEALAAEPHTRLRYFCSPQHADSAFYPLIGQFERAAGFVHGDTPQTKLDKLGALLRQTSTSGEDAALLAEMLSLPNDGRYPALELVPKQRRQKTLAALSLQLETLARSSPVLMILEDAHWSDPTSLEAFGHTVEQIAKLPVLLIVTFRPEFEPPWIGQPHVTALTINRLAEHEIGAIIDRVIGNKPLPANIRNDIIERTDGIPLFVEEMTKAVLEAGNELEALQTVTSVPSPVLAVPASLHASLMARLDRLGAAKEVAQIGAAIGREFSHALLTAVVRKTEAELGSALVRLIQAGLLFRQGLPPLATYLFKHALVQDVAYGTLLRTSRKQLHGRIANTLEKEFPELIEAEPELLARHCAEAGFNEQAIRYWRAAGEKAVRRASNREAIGHFRQALVLIEKQSSEIDRSESELAILSQLGPALMSVYSWSAPEVGVAFERAEHLARKLQSSVDLAPPLAGLWLFHTARGQFFRAEEITKELFHVARTVQDPDIELQAHHCAWPVCWFRGALSEAKAHADAGMALYDEVRHAKHRYLYLGHDPAVCALSIRSVLQWLLGYPVQAEQSERDAVELARRLEHAPSLAHALWFVCQGQVARGDAPAVVSTARELLTLSEEHGLPQQRATGMAYLGWAIGQTADVNRGIRLLEDGLATYGRLGVRSNLCLIVCLLAETYLAAGQYGKGMEQTDLAIAVSSEIGDRWCLPRIHIIRGRLLQKLQETDAAEADLRMATDIAAAQSAKGLQLQGANLLGRLWRDQGKPQQARELLAPVYGWFTEGFDTPDLKQVKALLDVLA
ncbi:MULTISPECIES: adenylate/guanylate cyclase domain-containing protein [Bradyrhizobium]|jgi:class 3 adenylate cyclase/tetratricopeptide (TPR) repeat protein|uniref:adenylate/guanylate cyclase domain-containing protein n=1 Tax=Bradyrhizobium TaxID=374 RepID=UPI0004824DB0|nr:MULTISPECIES: adenylate/guanylate cyclase domain-containing protein [Bradyrhizobium]MCS3452014.1 class 3 adenylate cyclase/tetratricopeptide (TPR) repeat protein [Bradyrhizobium elkanii]MCS3565887.1 class 3 adenylate cyclase/tetratricopeptide (TPR) repeat protein [Bradyrhizobium elkanii]MCW2153383.1 class 3 adenylate cyclase/tetratricopeptide (TPR) repeat protein [Bradyrhizobium elkanii]MCW2356931.1 class 3 adenylate cyclase/tetratricopeptide (TPR) repeat protein [Bradyrhizobium elkanii]MCW